MLLTAFFLSSVLALQTQAPPTGPAPAPVSGAPQQSFAIPRIEGAETTVDGSLDEAVWARAARLSGFSEYRPVDGQPAAERTEVLVWFAPDAIHFGVRAFDSQPESIRATAADRDNLDREDSVRIFLDTFNDRRRAFVFGVNPLGVQEDGVQTEGAFNAGRMMGGAIDLSPDYHFESRGRLTDSGYEVEIRIPFKSLRYSEDGGGRWGLNVLRKTQRTGREDTWTPVQRVASFLGQSGTMEGLQDLQRGVVVEVQPVVTAAVNGARLPDGRFERGNGDVQPGANLRLGFTNVSVDATINPDFSQVESDAAQVTVNERFALFFAEKRPFFLEGIELFATPNQLVYTRRIVDPIVGGKVTGKIGRTGVALLSAVDDAGPTRDWVTLGRVRRDLGRDSLIGVTYTDRTGDAHFNRVAAADARIVFKNLYYVLAQVGGSWTKDTGATRASQMWQVEFDRTARQWGFNYRLTGFGRDFVAGSGFVPRSNIVELRAFNRLTYYGPRGALVESVSTFFGPSRLWEYADFGRRSPIEGGESVNVSGTLRGGWSFSVRGGHDFVKFNTGVGTRREVGVYNATMSVTTPVFAKVNGRVELRTGGAPIFAEATEGHETRVTASFALRPTRSVRMEGSLVRTRITRDVDGSLFALSTIPRLKVEFQPRRSLFFRVISEYRDETRLAADTRGLRMDWLLSFEPTPGTVVFAGYGAGYEQRPDLFQTEQLRRTSDGFFVKLAYQFRR